MDIKQIENAVNTADALYQEAVAEIDDNNYYQAIEKLEECKGAYLEILQYIDESNSDYKNIAKSIDEIIEQCDGMIEDCKQFLRDRAQFEHDNYSDDWER